MLLLPASITFTVTLPPRAQLMPQFYNTGSSSEHNSVPNPDSQVKPNVNTSEVAHFAALAAGWWNPQGEMRALHAINPLRLDYILKHTGTLFDKQILDIGCGGGLLAEDLALAGARVTALDMSASMLQVARQHAESQGLSINYLQQTAEEHAAIATNKYDVVACMELLEHVPDPRAVVTACSQLVKPQGYVFFSTINRTLKAWLLAIVAAEYLLNLVPPGTHHIQKFIRPSELCHWLTSTPLREHHITGINYRLLRLPSLWHTQKCFSLGGNTNVNYLLVAQHRG